jgi:plasmid maintenance system antidote protein VapI
MLRHMSIGGPPPRQLRYPPNPLRHIRVQRINLSVALRHQFDNEIMAAFDKTASRAPLASRGRLLLELVEGWKVAVLSRLLKELGVEERLDAMIDRLLKRLLFVRGLKSITSSEVMVTPSSARSTCFSARHAIGVPGNRIHAIVNGTRAITGDTDLRFCKFFGGYFLRLQNAYDTLEAKRRIVAVGQDQAVQAARGSVKQ